MLVHHPDAMRHILSPGHVESPQRLEAILRKADSLGLGDAVTVPKPASRAEVERTHDPSYVSFLEANGEGFLDVDTPLHPETFGFALLAAGAALLAARRCVATASPWFALTRPPGHHAGPDYGGGFCFLNNVAVAATELLRTMDRVAILDLDAHHGNGTSDVFAADGSVLYVSTHQAGLFPGTGPLGYVGEGNAAGRTVNLPFPPRSGDATYAMAFDEVVEPVLLAFRPAAILVSLGVDAHYKDPLAQLSLSSPGYLAIVGRALAVAREVSAGRIAFVLEGGYHLPALAEVVAGTLAAFRGESIHLQFGEKQDATARGRDVVRKARAALAPHWDL